MRPVAFGVPAEVAFDFLVDPRNRPVWQSSLRRVEEVAGDPHVGQTWVDVTSPGLRPAMRTTVLDRPSCWAEQGTWRGVAATLTLRFAPAATGCEVTAEVTVTGRGPIRVLGPVLEWAARRAVPTDLERAARILSERSP
jgi:Polyketide cyclase / dehydrase and lipid transport